MSLLSVPPLCPHLSFPEERALALRRRRHGFSPGGDGVCTKPAGASGARPNVLAPGGAPHALCATEQRAVSPPWKHLLAAPPPPPGQGCAGTGAVRRPLCCDRKRSESRCGCVCVGAGLGPASPLPLRPGRSPGSPPLQASAHREAGSETQAHGLTFKNRVAALARVAQRLERQPTDHRVSGSVPGQGQVPGVQAQSSTPCWGTSGRPPIDASLTHRCFPLSPLHAFHSP